MQKKLIAVAVAGALAAPAAVLAQSTVQVYGNAYMEYGFIDQGRELSGRDRADPDFLQSPGSMIGFKGEEKLGGGMSAWFQCESTADIRGQSKQGLCTRNSAIGLKGSFGNAFVGLWDTPFKRARVGNIGGRDAGAFGNAGLLYGGLGTNGLEDTATSDLDRGRFARRQENLISYDTPVFGGFQGMFAVSSTNSSTGLAANAAEAKRRIWSAAGVYRQGPLSLGIGYAENKKMYTTAPNFAGDEDAWHISAAYQMGSVRLGGVYTKQEANTGVGQVAKVDAWHIGAEWKLAGPHNVHFGYTEADDMKGTPGAANSAAPATRMGTRPTVVAAGQTGAKMWQVRYVHNLSKRTFAGVGYVHLKNDRNAIYNLGGLSRTQGGATTKGVVFNMGHRF